MGATLANGGVNPVTGDARHRRRSTWTTCCRVMATCGMYDFSGEWMYRTGLPAKSGVGGGILAVLPGQLGIGVFSPRLDAQGNSVRGVKACEAVADTLNLHLLDATATASPVVTRSYTAAQVSSKRVRTPGRRRAAGCVGSGSHGALQLQGDLFFATAERLVRTVEQLDPATQVVVLDAPAHRTGHRRGHRPPARPARRLGPGRDRRAVGRRTGVAARGGWRPTAAPGRSSTCWPDVDLALEHGEDIVLADAGHGIEGDLETGALEGVDLFAVLDGDDRAGAGRAAGHRGPRRRLAHHPRGLALLIAACACWWSGSATGAHRPGRPRRGSRPHHAAAQLRPGHRLR